MRLGIIIIAVLFFPAIGLAETLTVPSEYLTIQDAIDYASDGDIVLVDPGTYQENIDFLGKNIQVQSTGGMDVTVVNGNQFGSVVTFAGGETVDAILDGFELTNGYADDGGGIFCAAESSPLIMNCRISYNEAYYYGGGIYINGSSPTILDTYINDNVSWNGAGIYCYDASPEFRRTRIYRNEALGFGGGGIYCYNQSDFKMINCAIYENIGSCGAGLLCGLSWPELTNCVITLNESTYSGGGLYLFSNTFMQIWNTIIFYNTAPLEDQIAIDFGIADIWYSSVEGGWNIGHYCVQAQPRFVNESKGDFHLLSNSACIDKGSDLAPDLPETDFEGDPRSIDGRDVKKVLPRPDIGIDEVWYLKAINNTIANELGGTVNLELDARPEYANRSYVILGGASGYTPGWNLGSAVLPVNHDPLTNFLISVINTPYLVDFMGTLNAQGQAEAQLNVPELNPGLGDFTLYFAYTLINPFDYTSNHVEIYFIE